MTEGHPADIRVDIRRKIDGAAIGARPVAYRVRGTVGVVWSLNESTARRVVFPRATRLIVGDASPNLFVRAAIRSDIIDQIRGAERRTSIARYSVVRTGPLVELPFRRILYLSVD